MVLTASKLRQDVYRILDRVADTGAPVEVTRRGKRIRISLVDAPGKLERLTRRKVLRVEPETIVHMDWSDEWTEK
jgi:prevent-host-death family protein